MPDHIYSIEEIKTVIQNIGDKYGVERVTLFGSYARGDASISSDIDLRIDKGNLRGLFQLAGMQLDLEEKLRTRVDVLTTDSLDKKFLELIQNEEIVLYEQ